MKQYHFISHSCLSFLLVHAGRNMAINFSPTHDNVSHFTTTDEILAKKIRDHRWFREGKMKELPVKDISAKAKKAKTVKVKEDNTPAPYIITGKTMSPQIPMPSAPAPEEQDSQAPAVDQNSDESQVPEEDQNPKDPEEAAEESNTLSVEEVSSFMEAKEYMVEVLGIKRSECPNKAALAQLCQIHQVEFPNYPLE